MPENGHQIYLVIRPTPQQVYSEVVQQIKDLINSAMEANQNRHEDFDRSTSLFYTPLVGKAWWLETVEKELRQMVNRDINGH